MFQNYLITAYRTLGKRKAYTAVNILGLSVGIACCLFIALYVRHESSYDNFFPSGDRIYRIALERVYPERVGFFASSPVTVAPTLLDHYPEVEAATRLHRLFFQPEVPVRIADESFIETKYYFADSNFFRVFQFDFIEGTPAGALDARNKVVITDKTARRYFGEEPALNQVLQQGDSSYVVSGVIKDLPENSHMDFDLIGSIHDLPFIQTAITDGSWINPWVYTYIKLRPDADPATLNAKLPGMVDLYGAADMSNRLGANYAELGHRLHFFLQPLRDIHLHSKLDLEVKPTSDARYLYLLAAVALFILVLSCINFINLATARSAERAREVGIRKVMGSTRPSLIRQFIVESIVTCFLSFLVALAIVSLLLKPFNQLVDQSLSFAPMVTIGSIALILGLIILVGSAAGLYPALVISSVNPASVLKGSYASSHRGVWLRNGLIVFQFFITLTMISGTLAVGRQMKYIAGKDLGFEKEGVLVIRQAIPIGRNFEAFKNEVKQLTGVAAVGGTGSIPGDFMGSNIFRPGRPNVSDLRANIATYDDDFIATMNFQILRGRGFAPAFNDSLSVLLNQAAARELGLTDPVGEKLRGTAGVGDNPEFTVIGVVEDFHFTSLHQPITPLVIFNGNSRFVPVSIAIRAKSDQWEDLIARIETAWNAFVPNRSLQHAFLDDELNTLYEADRTTGRVFRLFTLVTIIIAFVGLFSLATYVIQLRTKEVGIRKILGASVYSLFILLSKNFIQLALLALIISIPLSYLAIRKWLEQFAYHATINTLIFLQAGLIAVFLVIAAVSYQLIRIWRLNPGDTLRTE